MAIRKLEFAKRTEFELPDCHPRIPAGHAFSRLGADEELPSHWSISLPVWFRRAPCVFFCFGYSTDQVSGFIPILQPKCVVPHLAGPLALHVFCDCTFTAGKRTDKVCQLGGNS